MSYSLSVALDILSLEATRLQTGLVTAYKIMHGFVDASHECACKAAVER